MSLQGDVVAAAYDPDADRVIDNEHVEALVNLAAGEAFSAYPVEASDIEALAVTNPKLANGAVDTEEIAADAVTAAKVLDSETLPVDISGDADTVDNEHAADIVTTTRVNATNPDADTVDGFEAEEISTGTDGGAVHMAGFAPNFAG